ncbi:MAG: hypothetical protein EOO37_00605 [Cytophagaceae bacterium]|nr:MAG: hypothetical protein EOO37_00605 [Cytophagaceae bacterium]
MQTQKLHLIEEVLHLESSGQIKQLTNFLAVLKREDEVDLSDIPPMPFQSAEEIEARLQEALCDVREGRVYSQKEAIALTKKWREEA